MPAVTPDQTDVLVRLSRRSLWLALGVILLLAATGAAQLAFPESALAAAAAKLSMLLPLAIVIAAAALRRTAGGASLSPSNPALQAVRNDELRQFALNRAWRNGFIAVLLLQGPLALLLTATAPDNAVALMAGASVVTGAVVMLACLLYYDR